jgi:light-harvesting complex II chlorophyll a/b binding protein 4
MAESVGEAQGSWLPFLPRPSYLDGTYPGDAGFDPLGLVNKDGWWYDIAGAKTPERRLAWMREAEVKHARLAMLAAAGWPLSELWHARIASVTGLPYVLGETSGRAPSVLNGNLGPWGVMLGFATLFASWLELNTLDQVHGLTATGKTWDGREEVIKEYTPGDLGFDPLGVYATYDPSSLNPYIKMKMQVDPTVYYTFLSSQKKEREAQEIRNGRLAMLAITGMAFQEAVYKTPVVEQTPDFFKPASGLAKPFTEGMADILGHVR